MRPVLMIQIRRRHVSECAVYGRFKGASYILAYGVISSNLSVVEHGRDEVLVMYLESGDESAPKEKFMIRCFLSIHTQGNCYLADRLQ